MDCRYPVFAGSKGRDTKPIREGQLRQIWVFMVHHRTQSCPETSTNPQILSIPTPGRRRRPIPRVTSTPSIAVVVSPEIAAGKLTEAFEVDQVIFDRINAAYGTDFKLQD